MLFLSEVPGWKNMNIVGPQSFPFSKLIKQSYRKASDKQAKGGNSFTTSDFFIQLFQLSPV
jgi:hypothetical protein